VDLKAEAGRPEYRVLKKISVAGADDYNDLAIDTKNRLLYVAERSQISVIDLDTESSRGQIAGTPAVHGIALAPDFRAGFATNGRANTATILDLQTFKNFSVVNTGENPTDVVYDDVSKYVFIMNQRSESITVVKVMTGTVAATIPLPEEPEGVVADGRGHLYVNLSDPSEVAVIDTLKLSISKRIPLKSCVEPTAITMDRNNSRLLEACANEIVAVVDPESGNIVEKLPVGRNVLVMGFDPAGRFAIAADAVGNVSLIQHESPNNYRIVSSVEIKARAIAIAVDSKTDRIFILANELVPRSQSNNHSTVKPNSSIILVLGKQ
jgi:YVTN family beta-propeller protein